MRFLVIDTETGGLDRMTCGLTEIAVVLAEAAPDWSETQVVEARSWLIRPDTAQREYSLAALAVQRRTLDDLREKGMEERVVMVSLRELLNEHFFEIVGYGRDRRFARITPWAHNAAFDEGMIAAAEHRTGIDLHRNTEDDLPSGPLAWGWRCSCALARRVKAKHGLAWPNVKLDTLLRYYDIEMRPDLRHTALGDATATAHLIQRLHWHLETGRPPQGSGEFDPFGGE